ncbi:MAG: HNH endonuclease [Bdellovibrionales bacterium]|nr:HNH endonuclease [Bdellovibrionales bacterium]
MSDDEYFFLNPEHTDPKRLKKEREKARELRQSSWWKQKIAQGLCHYCGRKFPPKELTMDHLVPLARGGTSTKNNLVPACKECNAKKKLKTPVDELLSQISQKPENDE